MIAENLALIKKELPENVKLVAVSKTKPVEAIQEAYKAGQRTFGENKAREMETKASELPKDIEWHFIGHLQRNKVKYIAPFVSLIHSIDSLRLLEEVDKQAKKNNRIINCLLQFHIATEETKFGLSIDEAFELLRSEEYKILNHINIVGVMGMASNSENEDLVGKEFENLKQIFELVKNEFFGNKPNFTEISMGMSGDYKLAILKGSSMVRIGSSIFGARNY